MVARFAGGVGGREFAATLVVHAPSVSSGSGKSPPQYTQRSRAPTSQYVPAAHWSLVAHAGMMVPTTTPTTVALCSTTIARLPAYSSGARRAIAASSGASAARKKTVAWWKLVGVSVSRATTPRTAAVNGEPLSPVPSRASSCAI